MNETAPGVVALGPTMTASGATTTINFVKGDIRANNVTMGLGAGGKLSAVYRSATAGATIDLIFDVTGFFTPDTSGATYHVLTPGRILDTRPTGSGHTNIGLAGKFANKSVRTFAIAGVKALGWSSALVPSAATAVTGNLTVTDASSIGYVSLGPTIAAVPSTSTLNVAAGATVANGVTVALKSGKLEAVWDGTAGSSADVIFDVTGYFTAGTRWSVLLPDRTGPGSRLLGQSRTVGYLREPERETLHHRRYGRCPNWRRRYQRQPDCAISLIGGLGSGITRDRRHSDHLYPQRRLRTFRGQRLRCRSGSIGSRRSRVGRHHRLQRQHRSRYHRATGSSGRRLAPRLFRPSQTLGGPGSRRGLRTTWRRRAGPRPCFPNRASTTRTRAPRRKTELE